MYTDMELKMGKSLSHNVKIVTKSGKTIKGEVDYFESRFEVAEDCDEDVKDVQAYITVNGEFIEESDIKTIKITDK